MKEEVNFGSWFWRTWSKIQWVSLIQLFGKCGVSAEKHSHGEPGRRDTCWAKLSYYNQPSHENYFPRAHTQWPKDLPLCLPLHGSDLQPPGVSKLQLLHLNIYLSFRAKEFLLGLEFFLSFLCLSSFLSLFGCWLCEAMVSIFCCYL